MASSEATSLYTLPLGLAHVYKAEFTVELSEVLAQAADKDRWATTFKSKIDGQQYEMEYKLDWTKVWKQELHLKFTEDKALTVSSFKSRIGRSRSRGVPWGSHQALYKTFIEKEAECKIEKLDVYVTVELRRMLQKQVEQKYELVKTLLDNVEATGDVELRGKNFVVKAHSIVLSMRSSTLKAKFERWTDGLPFKFNLDESIPEDATRAMVQYFYSKEVPKINAFENKHPFFRLADLLGQQDLMKDWVYTMRLEEEEIHDIMLWPELELPHMSKLKSRVASLATELSKKEIERHGLDLAREVLLAVRRRKEESAGGVEGNKGGENHGRDGSCGVGVSTSRCRESEAEGEDGPALKRVNKG